VRQFLPHKLGSGPHQSTLITTTPATRSLVRALASLQEHPMGVQHIYERVTKQIIEEIEAGNPPPWLKPWKTRRTGILPVNAISKRPYQGLNILVLWSEREEKGYADPLWLTYKQCQLAGGQVRKGERATQVIYVNKTLVKDENEDERLVPFMRLFHVFNIAQCDGLTHVNLIPDAELPEPERNERAEAFFAAIGAETRWGEAMAAYIPSKDCIVMPPRSAFLNPENVYATWAHEHIHYSGAKHRLNRDLSSRFKEESYAFEELVAELGAAMVCAMLQIKGELRHAGYVEHWLKILKGDSRAILSAASLASKAADYLRSFSTAEDA
jgi:antirestriction protein ArdC